MSSLLSSVNQYMKSSVYSKKYKSEEILKKFKPPVPLGFIISDFNKKYSNFLKQDTVSSFQYEKIMDILNGLKENEDFEKCSTFVDQILFFKSNFKLSQREIGLILGIKRGTVSTHLRQNALKKTYRHHKVFTEEMDVAIDGLLHMCESESLAVTPTMINLLCQEINENFKISKEGIRKHMEKIHGYVSRVAQPEDLKRVELELNDIIENYRVLKNTVNETHPSLLINIDEIGFCDWADRQSCCIFVKKEHIKSDMKFGVSRSSKRSSLICAICADGTYIHPAVVIPNIMYDKKIDEQYPSISVFKTSTGFVNKQIFSLYILETVLPWAVSKREQMRLGNQRITITADNFSAHVDDQVMNILARYNIFFHFYKSHSSHLVQPLDCCLFGCIKKNSFSTTKLLKKLDTSVLIDHQSPMSAFVTSISTPEVINSSKCDIEMELTKWIESLSEIDESVNQAIGKNERRRPGELISSHMYKVLSSVYEKSNYNNIKSSFKRSGIVVKTLNGESKVFVDISHNKRLISQYDIPKHFFGEFSSPSISDGNSKAIQVTEDLVKSTIERYNAF